MSETTRNPNEINPAFVEALWKKRDDLLAERNAIRLKQADLATRDREIDRDLADVQAAGRVFGVVVDLPEDESKLTWGNFQRVVRQLDQRLTRQLEVPTGIVATGQAPKTEASAAAKAVVTKTEMPRVSDIVLDRLKVAGAAGSTAAPIQKYIQETYWRKIHDKTVGMTLYRLARDGYVRRDGHTWFITEKGMNPGAAAPGTEELLK